MVDARNRGWRYVNSSQTLCPAIQSSAPLSSHAHQRTQSLTSRPRQHAAVLESDAEPTPRDQRPDHPQRERQAHAAHGREDRAGRREDAAAYHPRHDEDVRAAPCYRPAGRRRLGDDIVFDRGVLQGRGVGLVVEGLGVMSEALDAVV